MRNFTLSADWGDSVIDVRDIIERVEELESDIDLYLEEMKEDGYSGYMTDNEFEMNQEELLILTEFLEAISGSGGDEEWRGDWYPVTLINDDYFQEYAQELAEDTGAIDRNVLWPHTCIDWAQAASELQQDYTTADMKNFAGETCTYWFR